MYGRRTARGGPRSGPRLAAGITVLVLAGCGRPDADPPAESVGVPEDTHDWAPAWSPDGQRIAFNAGPDEEGDIYVMGADGSRRTRLTFAAGENERPRWSPDGRRIAFNSSRKGNVDIYVMNADGSEQMPLTTDEADDARADWSPDGRRIVFDSERDGNREIYVMEADGSNKVRLTHHPGTDGYPSWSPDGEMIVFNSDRDGDGEIYVMAADGSGMRQLTHNEGALDQAARWSPDGRRITFFSNRDNESDIRINESEIYVMDADGSNETRLTTARGWDFMPSWSPDGGFIVFDSQRDGRRSLYVMTANGFAQTKITNLAPSEFIVTARQRGVETAIAEYEWSQTTGDKSTPPAPFYQGESEALAYELLDGRRTDEALRLLRFNAAVFPDRPGVFVTLAEAYLRLGNKPESVRAYETALALSPGDSLVSAGLRMARVD